jgi:polyphosphate glucokinase
MDAVLAVDVGGTHVKVLASGETEPRRAASGPRLRPERAVEKVLELADGWDWDKVVIGLSAPVHGGRLVHDPVNLGPGWVGFDFAQSLGRPTRVVNDAAMQALGSYEGGKMLFLGLGTGLGSALVSNGIVMPMELGHLPYRRRTFEHFVGEEARKERGEKRWTTSCSAAGTRTASRNCPRTPCAAATRTRSSAHSASGTRTRPRAYPSDAGMIDA